MSCGGVSTEDVVPNHLGITRRDKEVNSSGYQTGYGQKTISYQKQCIPIGRCRKELFYISVEINLGHAQRDGEGK